jgi:hypothetical protein
MKRAPFRLALLIPLSLGSLLASGCASGGAAKEAPPPTAFASSAPPRPPAPLPPPVATPPLGQVGNVSAVATAPGAPTASQNEDKKVEAERGGGTTPLGVVPSGGSGLTEEAVQRAVQEQFGVFDPCYEHLSGKPRGQLQVKATITRSGAVSSVSVSDSTFRVARFDDCVGTSFQQIRFGASEASGVFLVPLAWGG